MQVQINTNNNIDGHATMAADVTGVVEETLQRFSAEITRVEVHVADDNGPKGGNDDKRCMMEARLKGRQPLAATHHATTVKQAAQGAANKLFKVIESTLARAEHTALRPDSP